MPDPPRVVIATLKFHAARRDPGKHEILYLVFDDSRAAHLCLFVVSEPKPVAGPAARITASCSPAMRPSIASTTVFIVVECPWARETS